MKKKKKKKKKMEKSGFLQFLVFTVFVYFTYFENIIMYGSSDRAGCVSEKAYICRVREF